uniref:Core domain-containing protein n=1 Tax=Eucampia antarctica TaxID=49252 RepID=A0A7S2WRK0_9STRA|mmetsp:Transcript_9901/g.9591  ORF Transcript_9901/g.9591 Transcript_9901/m.9591 type:complete len:193 (+) Transcript_9901:72-650(+)
MSNSFIMMRMLLVICVICDTMMTVCHGFSVVTTPSLLVSKFQRTSMMSLRMSTDEPQQQTQPTTTAKKEEREPITHEEPEDAVIHITNSAMTRLRELVEKSNESLVLRMGVRNGGCSGLSYVMDFSTPDDIAEDDAVDSYESDGVTCVVDAKSLLYLYGLELDYSDELIGGGFKFFNPNAEESCGCGSSFGV